MVIGVTGASGSGKSIVSKILKDKLRCHLIDADVVTKRISKKGNIYYNEIVKAFGEEILDEQKEIVRSKLAEIVYNDDGKREILNDITNIYVVKAIKQEIDMFLKKGIVIIDVPRLIESGLSEVCNVIIGVIADKDIRMGRICNRDNIAKKHAEERLRIQPRDKFYIDNTDYLIENNGDKLEEEVNLMVDILNRLYRIKEEKSYEFA